MIKGPFPLLLLGLLMALPLYSQSGEGVPLGETLESINSALGALGPGAERHRLLLRQARLLSLSGDTEGALRSWNEAVLADPRAPDYRCILEASRCYIAMGELDTALRALEVARSRLASLSPQEADEIGRGCVYLASFVEALKTGNGAGLEALLSDPFYASYHASTLFTLWKLTGNDAYKAALDQGGRDNPETGIARSDGRVAAAPTPLWLLAAGGGGRAYDPLAPQPQAPQPQAQPSVPPAAEQPIAEGAARRAGTAEAPAGEGVKAEGGEGGEVLLQTGLFSREENAQVMAERLKKSGFTERIVKRDVGGEAYWAVLVVVPPGYRVDTTIIRLKDAGFESYLAN